MTGAATGVRSAASPSFLYLAQISRYQEDIFVLRTTTQVTIVHVFTRFGLS